MGRLGQGLGSIRALGDLDYICAINYPKAIVSLNKVILIGNVGNDPEIRYFDSHSALAQFRLATSEPAYRLDNGTEVPQRTEWHNVVAFRDQARFAEQWIKKGSLLHIEGKIRYRSYVDKAGVQRYVTEIVADRISFFDLGRRVESARSDPSPTSK